MYLYYRGARIKIIYRIAQIFVVKYFRDFRELHRNHEKKLPQKFPYTPPLSTGLHTSKSRNNDESQKLAKIMKIFNHKKLELYGSYFRGEKSLLNKMLKTISIKIPYH